MPISTPAQSFSDAAVQRPPTSCYPASLLVRCSSIRFTGVQLPQVAPSLVRRSTGGQLVQVSRFTGVQLLQVSRLTGVQLLQVSRFTGVQLLQVSRFTGTSLHWCSVATGILIQWRPGAQVLRYPASHVPGTRGFRLHWCSVALFCPGTRSPDKIIDVEDKVCATGAQLLRYPSSLVFGARCFNYPAPLVLWCFRFLASLALRCLGALVPGLTSLTRVFVYLDCRCLFNLIYFDL